MANACQRQGTTGKSLLASSRAREGEGSGVQRQGAIFEAVAAARRVPRLAARDDAF